MAPPRKLTDAQLAEIRTSDVSDSALARKFFVNRQTVTNARKRMGLPLRGLTPERQWANQRGPA